MFARKWAFIKNGMNVVDVLAILPYYVEMGLAIKRQQLLDKQNIHINMTSFTVDNIVEVAAVVNGGPMAEEEEDDNVEGILQARTWCLKANPTILLLLRRRIIILGLAFNKSGRSSMTVCCYFQLRCSEFSSWREF